VSRKLPKYSEDSYVHFVTSNTRLRIPFFLEEVPCGILIGDIRFYQEKLGFKTLAWVIMPNHFHALFWWDKEENPHLTISTIMQRIKSHSGKEIYRCLKSLNKFPHGGTSVWQEGFYDFNLYGHEKIEEKIHYIHMNPVRRGLVKQPDDYKWSSYREFLEL